MDRDKNMDSINDEIRRRRRMDIFALNRRKDDEYVMSFDDGCPYKIIHRGLDATPKIYNLPGVTRPDTKDVSIWLDELTDLIQDISERDDQKQERKQGTIFDPNELFKITQYMKPIERLDVWHSKKDMDEWIKNQNCEKAPPMFYLKDDQSDTPLNADDEIFTTRLQETPMVELFDVATNLVRENGKEDKKQLKLVEMQKEKKDKFALLITNPFKKEFTQTSKKYVLDNWCGINASERENKGIEVYVYDRKKTFIELGIHDPWSQRRSKIHSFFESIQSNNEHKDIEKLAVNNIPKQEKSHEDPSWVDSIDLFSGIILLERILSSNLSMQLQLLYNERLYSPETVGDFKYLPQLLWIMSCPKVFGKAVTSISWNHLIPDLFAVSYGKYLLNTETDGVVCIWNIKNTENPERMSVFNEPCTYVEFSQRSHRILSVAFWDGTVALMDGILKEPELLVQCDFQLGSLLPVYQFKWLQLDDEEALVSCGENGEIHLFQQNLKFRHKMIMKIRDLGNTVNLGIDASHRKPVNDFCPLGPGASIICQHPRTKHIYLVGSDVGFVYICSLYRHRKHVGVFVAHNSAVTSIHFNPADDRVLLTSGCDFYIRVWIYGHFETYLLQLKNRQAYVDFAVWNPVHPYMIVSVVRQFVEVWHIKENAFDPISIEQNPYKNRNLVVSFNPSGSNFLVGDMKGYIFVYSFTSIPKPPKDPLIKLNEALKHALQHDKMRLKMLAKILREPGVAGSDPED